MTTKPTNEKLREEIASWVWVEVYQNIGISWGGIKAQSDAISKKLVTDCYRKADQILSLLQAALDEKDEVIQMAKRTILANAEEKKKLKADSQKRVEGIFREIFELSTPDVLVYEHDGENPSLVITMKDWQALKSKEGVK